MMFCAGMCLLMIGIHRARQRGHWYRNFGSPSWVLVEVLGFICRWQYGACLHRFHYEQDDLIVNESIGCFIFRISLVIRHSKIKRTVTLALCQ